MSDRIIMRVLKHAFDYMAIQEWRYVRGWAPFMTLEELGDIAWNAGCEYYGIENPNLRARLRVLAARNK